MHRKSNFADVIMCDMKRLLLVLSVALLSCADISALTRSFEELQLGTVKPDGWLLEMLLRQRDGITACLDEVYPQVVGERNGWLGGDGDQWERGPYWIDGLLPMAYILDDQILKEKASRWVEWTLSSQREDGQFGPLTDYPKEPGLQRGKSEDWWPRMVMLKVLMQYYNATQDGRVLSFMDRYFRYQLKTLPDKPLDNWTRWAEFRACDNMIAALWLYKKTGKKYLLDLCDLLHEQGWDFTHMFLETRQVGELSTIHCVNLAQGLKEPLVYWQMRPKKEYMQAVDKCLADLRIHGGYPNGMFGGDEALHGNNPVQGVELCSIVEMMYSLEEMIKISGKISYADHLERIAFNALPAQITDDFKEHQYFQQVNQVSITRGAHNFDIVYDGTASLMGVLCGYPCCLCNLHQGWPKFIQNLWYRNEKGGLAAMVYAPCHFTTDVKGVEVTVEEKTYYPMDGRVEVSVSMSESQSVQMPMQFRIPSWATGVTVEVNGTPVQAVPGEILTLDRKWKNSDVVVLDFPMAIRTDTWYENAVSVERGPLVYALKIDEKWEKVTLDPKERKGDYYWQVTAESPWNYALMFMASIEPEKHFTERVDREKLKGNWYWSQNGAPITLTAKATRIKDWTLYNGDTGPIPFSIRRSRIYNGRSSHKADSLETVELIPYGCTTLRICEFPLVTW